MMFQEIRSLLKKVVYIGRGSRSVSTIHRRLGVGRYVPHQSAREILRRRAQVARGQIGPAFDATASGILGLSLVCGSRRLHRWQESSG